MSAAKVERIEIARGAAPPGIIRIQPTRGWVSLRLRDLWEYRELLYFLVWRDVAGQHRAAEAVEDTRHRGADLHLARPMDLGAVVEHQTGEHPGGGLGQRGAARVEQEGAAAGLQEGREDGVVDVAQSVHLVVSHPNANSMSAAIRGEVSGRIECLFVSSLLHLPLTFRMAPRSWNTGWTITQ